MLFAYTCMGVALARSDSGVYPTQSSRHYLCPHTSMWKPNAAELHSRIDLCYADLSNANLAGANLSGAKLVRADMSHAILVDANLTGANLAFANFENSDLSRANLTNADLHNAFLIKTKLSAADLTGATLNGAVLTDAILYGTNVTKASIASTNLTNAFYAPTSEPPAPYVAGIKGLETLHLAVDNQVALVQLRNLLHDAGLQADERRATASIERNITRDQFHFPLSRFQWVGGLLRFVGFDLTTAYGLYPWRALMLIALLGGIFTCVYIWPIWLIPQRAGSGVGSGIFQRFPADRIVTERVEESSAPRLEKDAMVVRIVATNALDAYRKAAWFSLLSAFNIGFEQFSPGDWIRRMQARDYILESVGWVRVVAGVQSVLSVYLLAIWALTQFGHPFN